MLPAASAAAALAQLHSHRLENEWESDVVGQWLTLAFYGACNVNLAFRIGCRTMKATNKQ